MTKTAVALTDASAKQLRAYATVQLGIDVPPTANSRTIIGLIAAVDHNITEIEVEEDANQQTAPIANDPKPTELADQLSTHYKDDPKITVIIASKPGKGGDRDVQIAHNGDVVLVKPDVPAELPYRFYLALREAIEKDISQTRAEPGRPAEIVVRDLQSYPFQIVPESMPSREEIAAWMKRMDGLELGEPSRQAGEKKRQAARDAAIA